ncbi:hypothetical protein LQ772_06685 [Frateuria edaphi]|uniref:hypothetical protein n=1 Tax=Frateuria edaphi TaxID=2898793 RepID=UPI001E4DDDFC|nr:hypothetical protein [Frateuria edaphi]UGB46972.1 hypothetical protein LQ772_06685 [Frateuria edaphi]
MKRSDAWFDRQLAHVRACLAEADRRHTPEEIAAHEAALAVLSTHPQAPLPLKAGEKAHA